MVKGEDQGARQHGYESRLCNFERGELERVIHLSGPQFPRLKPESQAEAEMPLEPRARVLSSPPRSPPVMLQL